MAGSCGPATLVRLFISYPTVLVTDMRLWQAHGYASLSGMAPSLAFPPVTDELLSLVVQRICSVGAPRKIVLFGSHAKGTARPDSDLDILIIEDSDLPRYARSARYRRVLCGLFPAKDIVVWTPQEVRDWQGVPNAFISEVLAEGKVLYER